MSIETVSAPRVSTLAEVLATIGDRHGMHPGDVANVAAMSLESEGESYGNATERDALLGVYAAGKVEFVDDAGKWYTAGKPAYQPEHTQAPATPSDTPSLHSTDPAHLADATPGEVASPGAVDDTVGPDAIQGEPAPVADPAETSRKHNAGVKAIVKLVIAKFEDEGARNLAIGEKALRHAQWQRAAFPGYEKSDFDNLMTRVRDEARVHLSGLKPESIRVDDWARARCLQNEVRKVSGDVVADGLTFHDYNTLAPRALKFDKASVEGTLKAGWLDMMKFVGTERAAGRRVSADKFKELIAKAEIEIKAALVQADPKSAALESAKAEVKAASAKTNKAIKSVMDAVESAFVDSTLTGDTVVRLLETSAKQHGVSLPSQYGFDPAKATTDDCVTLANAMMASGKYAEMVALRDRLTKMIDAVDRAKNLAISRVDGQSLADAEARKAG